MPKMFTLWLALFVREFISFCHQSLEWSGHFFCKNILYSCTADLCEVLPFECFARVHFQAVLFRVQGRQVQAQLRLEGHYNDVVQCDFSPDGALLATASFDTQVANLGWLGHGKWQFLPLHSVGHSVIWYPGSTARVSGAWQITVLMDCVIWCPCQHLQFGLSDATATARVSEAWNIVVPPTPKHTVHHINNPPAPPLPSNHSSTPGKTPLSFFF